MLLLYVLDTVSFHFYIFFIWNDKFIRSILQFNQFWWFRIILWINFILYILLNNIIIVWRNIIWMNKSLIKCTSFISVHPNTSTSIINLIFIGEITIVFFTCLGSFIFCVYYCLLKRIILLIFRIDTFFFFFLLILIYFINKRWHLYFIILFVEWLFECHLYLWLLNLYLLLIHI